MLFVNAPSGALVKFCDKALVDYTTVERAFTNNKYNRVYSLNGIIRVYVSKSIYFIKPLWLLIFNFKRFH